MRTTRQDEGGGADPAPSAPALDPALAKIAARAAAQPRNERPLAEVRRDVQAYLDAAVVEPVASVEDREIAGPGGPLRLRIYRPEEAGTRPLVLFFHGSGFVFLSIETHDATCRQICRRSGAVVISVDYRLAPENPWPAAPDDAFHALRWAVGQAEALGVDPARVAVCGDSAGGNLAAVVAQRARAAGGPALAAQLLFYPVLDHHSVRRPSWTERGEGFGLSSVGMTWFWDLYLPDPSMGASPDVSPIRAQDLSGLPPAYVATAEFDLLRDEGDEYARRLAEAGVPTAHVRHPDLNHGFLFWLDRAPGARRAMDDAGAWLRRALAIPAADPGEDRT